MTFTIGIGKWGGFYWHWRHTKRLCIGWIAITIFPFDMDILLMKLGEPLEPNADPIETFALLRESFGESIQDPADEVISLADAILRNAEGTATADNDEAVNQAYTRLHEIGRESAIEAWNGISPNQEVKQ